MMTLSNTKAREVWQKLFPLKKGEIVKVIFTPSANFKELIGFKAKVIARDILYADTIRVEILGGKYKNIHIWLPREAMERC